MTRTRNQEPGTQTARSGVALIIGHQTYTNTNCNKSYAGLRVILDPAEHMITADRLSQREQERLFRPVRTAQVIHLNRVQRLKVPPVQA